VHVADITAVKSGQQALLAQWTAAATESRQGRDQMLRLAAALADRDAEVLALRGAGHEYIRSAAYSLLSFGTVQQMM